MVKRWLKAALWAGSQWCLRQYLRLDGCRCHEIPEPKWIETVEVIE